MNISVEQYRCAIGVHAGNVGGTGRGMKPVSSPVSFLNFSFILFILMQLLNIPDRQTYDKRQIFKKLLCIFFLFAISLMLIITFGIQIELDRDSKLPSGSNHKQTDRNYPDLPLFLKPHLALTNWLVVLILFSSHCNRRCPIILYIVAGDFCTYKRNKWSYCYRIILTLYEGSVIFISLINLILIVIVTPSIVNPGPGPPNPNKRGPTELSVAYCNMQGVILMASMRSKQPIFQTNKLLDFQNFVYMNRPDIVIINESWLNEHIHSNEVIDENIYKCFRQDRTQADKDKYNKTGGGGVFILVKQDLDVHTKLVSIDNDSLPIVSIEIKFSDNSKICISTFYRYGYSKADTFNSAEKYYRGLCIKYNKIILIGDLNLSGIDDWQDPQSLSSIDNAYIDLFNDLGLQCMINSPTHRGGNILDLLLTNQPALVKDLSIEPDLICSSDHYSVTFKLRKFVARRKTRKQKVFKYSEADWNGLSHELASFEWNSIFDNLSITDAWNMFKSKLDISMRKFIPFRNVKFRQQPPWMDSEMFEMSKTKHRLRKNWKSSACPEPDKEFHKEIFKNYEARFKQKCEEKKRIFLNADPCDDDPTINKLVNKKFWTYIKSNTKCGRIPDTVHYNGRFRSNKTDQCESFNTFFCDQFSEASNYNIALDFTTTCPDTLFTSFEVYSFLRKIKPEKGPGPDGISGHILKNCASALSRPLSILFNKSYCSGLLPSDWKKAHVVPIHKKGRKDDVKNYRPISLTSLVMKIFEKSLRNRLYQHCKHFITNKQHGFLPERSCTTQMLNYTDTLALHLNEQSQTDVIYFDFAKAFDSVNHDTILHKLKFKYNVDGYLLRFLKEYLKGRQQCVTIDGEFSSYTDVQSGVPQGSILGPLLFVLFINDAVDVIDINSNILLYADDMKLYREIRSSDDQTILQSDINSLVQWALDNKIKFHPGKCKVLRCTLKKHNSLSFIYTLSNVPIEISNSERDLGVMITPSLKWNKHHATLLGKASQKLGLLRRSCSFTRGIAHRRTLYLAIVRSQFEHCSTIWRPVTVSQSDKFEALQKRGVKWILGEDFALYSKKLYFEKLKVLDILPINLKFDYNDLSMFFKIFFTPSEYLDLPHYLVRNDEVEDHSELRRHTRSITLSDPLQVTCNITPKVDAFEDTFFYRTHKKWNSLPLKVRECLCLNTFQSQLKKLLWLTAQEQYCKD